MSSDLYGSAFVVLIGAIFATSFAAQTFREAVAVNDIPTPLEYLVRRRPRLLGQTAFVCFCLASYAFVLFFYKQLPQLAELLPDQAKQVAEAILKTVDSSVGNTSVSGTSSGSDQSFSLLVIVAAITTTFLYVIRTSFKGNIVFAFRSLVHGWIAVPIACQHATDQLLDNLNVPNADRLYLQLDPRLHIHLADFDESAGPIEKQWAELAYMDLWIQRQKKASQGADVFIACSFDADQLEREFIALRELTRLLDAKEGDDEAFVATLELLKRLRAKYARYVACILMSVSSSRVDFYRRCNEVGINPGPLTVENPFHYSAQFVLTLAIAIAVGPYLFAVGYDLSQGRGVVAFIDQKFEYLWTWLVLGFASYLLPIFVVLLARYISWLRSEVREQVSLAIYAWVFLGVLFISLVGAAVATLSLRHGYPSDWTWELVIEAVRRNAPWTIAPALTAVYINYYLDRQADPSKQDIDQRKETIVPRLLMAFAYTFGIALLSILIVAYQQISEHIWPRAETQLIVVGTTALVNLSLCLTAQFGLKKPVRPAESAKVGVAIQQGV